MTERALVDAAGVVLAARVRVAASPLARLVGWLGRRRIEPDEGLWFERCNAVHTLGMRTAIDVVFVDRDGAVCAVAARVAPGNPYVGDLRAAGLYEMAPGFIERAGVRCGDRLSLRFVQPAASVGARTARSSPARSSAST